MSHPTVVMKWSSEINWFRIEAVVALLSRWLSRMIIFRRRSPESLPLILYWSSQTITFVLPNLEREPIRQWYNIFVSWAARVGEFMYDFSNLRTSSRSNSPWLVRRFVYFIGRIRWSGITNIPKTSLFHWYSVARSKSVFRNWWTSSGTQSKLSSLNREVPFLCSLTLSAFAKLITPCMACVGFNANGEKRRGVRNNWFGSYASYTSNVRCSVIITHVDMSCLRIGSVFENELNRVNIIKTLGL